MSGGADHRPDALALGTDIIGFSIGIFIYQAFGKHQWDVALEHSFFGAAGAFLMWLNIRRSMGEST